MQDVEKEGRQRWGEEILLGWAALGSASVEKGRGRVSEVEIATRRLWRSPAAGSATGNGAQFRGCPSSGLWRVSVVARGGGGMERSSEQRRRIGHQGQWQNGIERGGGRVAQ